MKSPNERKGFIGNKLNVIQKLPGVNNKSYSTSTTTR